MKHLLIVVLTFWVFSLKAGGGLGIKSPFERVHGKYTEIGMREGGPYTLFPKVIGFGDQIRAIRKNISR